LPRTHLGVSACLVPFHSPNLNRIRAHRDTSAKLRECLGYGKAPRESIAFCSQFSQEMREDKGVKRAPLSGFGWILALASLFSGPAGAQTTPALANPAPIVRRDPALDAAANLIGKALYLRCFCEENNLSFDAQGHPLGTVKTTDWTLAAVNVQKVDRKSPTELEFEGVRVAIRFAPDRREFDRHPLNDDKMKIQLADSGDPAAFARELSAIFAEGLDLRLQAAMPGYWKHYFNPQLAWPSDELSGVPIYVTGPSTRIPGATAGGEGFIPVGATKKASASYTPQAGHDRVQGDLVLRVVVDAKGNLQRVVIEQPLGYGLDARAIESLSKWKFTPAKLNGKPVAAYSLIRPEFEIVDIPH
jgi:TonB family protein